MVCIVSVTTTLIFDECKPVDGKLSIFDDQRGDSLTIGWKRFLELECHNAQGDQSFKDVRLASQKVQKMQAE